MGARKGTSAYDLNLNPCWQSANCQISSQKSSSPIEKVHRSRKVLEQVLELVIKVFLKPWGNSLQQTSCASVLLFLWERLFDYTPVISSENKMFILDLFDWIHQSKSCQFPPQSPNNIHCFSSLADFSVVAKNVGTVNVSEYTKQAIK